MAAHLGKLRQLILFFIYHKSAQPIGHTKLYKLLYFSDKRHLETTGKSITSAEYRKQPYGPVPTEGLTALQDLIRHRQVQEERIILQDGRPWYKLTAIQEPNLSLFTASERVAMNWVLEIYGQATAKAISELSHEESTWLLADDWSILDMASLAAGSKNKDAASEAIAMIDAWYDTPDKKGSAYWDDLAQEISSNRMHWREEDTDW